MAVKLGLELYSLHCVQKELDENPRNVIKKVLDLGFRHLEPANGHAENDPGTGYHIPAEELRDMLEPYGAKIGSHHIGNLNDETLPAVMEYNRILGNRNLVVPIYFYTGYDHVMQMCEHFNHVGKVLIENGFNPLVYHNHYHEYQVVNGKPILYWLIENTAPEYVHFEMDCGWDVRAGEDPITEMKKIGNRLRLIHIKDYRTQPANLLIGRTEMVNWDNFGANHQEGDKMTPGDFVSAGEGMMPLGDILKTADELGVEAAVWEQDDCGENLYDSLAKTIAYLKQFKHLYI